MKPPAIARLAAVLLGASLTVGINTAPAEASLSQCTSGYVCVWSGASYTGTFKRFSSTGSYQSIGLTTVGSYYNYRSRRTYLHEKTDGSGYKSCLTPGAKAAALTGWKARAKAVYLSTTTSC